MRIYPVLAVRSHVADSKDPSDSTPNLPLSLDLGTISVYSVFSDPLCYVQAVPLAHGPGALPEGRVVRHGQGRLRWDTWCNVHWYMPPFHVDIAVL